MIKTAKNDCSPRSIPRHIAAGRALATFMLFLGLARATAAQTPDSLPSDLVAAGPSPKDNDRCWVARIVPRAVSEAAARDAVDTRLYVRDGQQPFASFGSPIQGRVVSAGYRGEQLALLLSDGGWLLQSGSGVAVGPPFPVPEARLLTFATGRDALFALVRLPGGTELWPPPSAGATGAQHLSGPATAPSSAPVSAPASSPASRSTTHAASTTRAAPAIAARLALVAYRDGAWQPVEDLTPTVARDTESVSLALQDDVPFVLTRESTQIIRLWRLDNHTWTEVGAATIPASTRRAQLIFGGPKPTVLLSAATAVEADRVLVFNASVTESAPTSGPASFPTTHLAGTPKQVLDVSLPGTAGTLPQSRAATFAMYGPFRSLRLLNDELTEQSYDRQTLAPLGEPSVTPMREPGIAYSDWIINILVGGAIVAAILLSVRRREKTRALNLDPAELPLAPLGVRLLAGLIDAVPLIAALFAFVAQTGGDVSLIGTGVSQLWLLSGAIVYIFHTTLVECLAGRSLGKLICGLQVVSVDGSTPSTSQLLTRNLLRIIDVGLKLLPLVLVPFSPLRQRAGDAAAGTLVVTKNLVQAEEVEAVKPEGDNAAS